ncbi:hypothetical protein B9Q13_05040 [Candidatus Marsarchaeota G2 archaeon ECH_B_SAG-G16]|uniref:Brix domain-containing protein n=2 Tax=Candidatus Marsarchaeota TaxID=1978152 RepID=A0A2R6C060_9ARCH|nr:MAG: hypothetical protein B9Q13_05040 [Candidatus Marsarchaeota G2 archaeon ECH_B_SAG-G16]
MEEVQKVVFTTSRSPSPRSRTLLNALTLTLPSLKLTRGKKSMKEILSFAEREKALIVKIIEKSGNPRGFEILPKGEFLLFDGFSVVKGIKKLLQKNKVSKVVASEKEPLTEKAKKLKQFFLSLPASEGNFTTRVEIFQKGDREVLSLNVKGVECVNFYFRLNK